MTDCQSRIALLLALTPITVAAFTVAGAAHVPAYLPWPNVDSLQIAALGATLAFVAGWWLIWRRLVQRDPARSAATAALAALILGQVLVWQPLWHSGNCAHNDMLRGAQSLGGLGLWCLGFVLTWWGGRRWRHIRHVSKYRLWVHSKARSIMTPGAVRLAAGYSLIPLLPAIFFIMVIVFDDLLSLSSEGAGFLSYLICVFLAVGMWLALWRRAVLWTIRRQWWTIGLGGLMIVSPFTQFIPEADFDLIDLSVDIAPVFALAIWFAGTAWAWRLKPGELPAAARKSAAIALDADDASPHDDGEIHVPCAQCDYDLRGLREARCPECGWTTTLDALVRRGVAMNLAAAD